MKTNHFSRVIILAALVLFGTQLIAANSFAIKGKIMDSSRNGVSNATVTLMDVETMEIIAVDCCGKNGKFSIENIKEGDYIMTVSKPGFKKIETRFINIDEKGVLTYHTNVATTTFKNPANALNNINLN